MSSKVNVNETKKSLSIDVDLSKVTKVETSDKQGKAKVAMVACKIGSSFGGEKMLIGGKWYTISAYIAETTAPTVKESQRI